MGLDMTAHHELTHAQVAVVGGGPAGAATATLLAREGVDVLLVDAQRFPRFKPCGEFMSPQCLPLLESLGAFDKVRGLGARPVRGMELVSHGLRSRGRFVDVGRARAPFEHGWALRREVFDSALLDNARAHGVRVLEGWRVRRLLTNEAGCVRGFEARGPRGETRAVHADWTVGADGLNSRVASELGVQRDDPALRRIAFTTRYRGASRSDFAQAHFFHEGYFALAPVDEGLVSVNLVLSLEAFEREGLPRDAAYETWLRRAPAVLEQLAGAERIDPLRGIGPLARRTTQQTFDGAALVGDACGYVDPVTGEGVFFALQGAAMLAPALLGALRTQRTDRAALDSYLRGRARELAPRARLCRWFVQAMEHPWLAKRAFGLLASRQGLADLAVSLTGDYAPPRELLRPSVWRRALAREPA
jgi:flavin-dependent dehydrogenase